jgi:hypothetical protein
MSWLRAKQRPGGAAGLEISSMIGLSAEHCYSHLTSVDISAWLQVPLMMSFPTYISCTVSTAACEICTVRWLNRRDLLESRSSTFWRPLYFLAADRGLKYIHSLKCYNNPTCNAWLRITTVKRCTLRFALATKIPHVV